MLRKHFVLNRVLEPKKAPTRIANECYCTSHAKHTQVALRPGVQANRFILNNIH
jgi:hypothetical protein